MTTIPAPPGAPTEARLTQRLLDTLQPMQLEVLDES